MTLPVFPPHSVFLSHFLEAEEGGRGGVAPVEAAAATAAAGAPMPLCFWRSREPINGRSQRGTERSESQLFPEATGDEEAETARGGTQARGSTAGLLCR